MLAYTGYDRMASVHLSEGPPGLVSVHGSQVLFSQKSKQYHMRGIPSSMTIVHLRNNKRGPPVRQKGHCIIYIYIRIYVYSALEQHNMSQQSRIE